MTQARLASRLERHQSYVSKYESTERTLDVLELRQVLLALGTTLPDFVKRLERELHAVGPGTPPQRF